MGKTTTSCALLAGLHQRGCRVLGVDLDPQGSLGFCLGLDINFTILRDDKKVQRDILFFCKISKKIIVISIDKGEIDMASINGVSGNNLTSSLYNSANVISGLASGLDTEGMIEGLVQSYQKKIQSLSNKVRGAWGSAWAWILITAPPFMTL